MKSKILSVFIGLLVLCWTLPARSQLGDTLQPPLSVKQIMNALITPGSATIWGAYQLETEAEWLEIENAALTVIAAGSLLAGWAAGSEDQAWAAEADWQSYNSQMMAAARLVITAVGQKDEAALSSAGNDALYPPCESCHQKYQAR